MKKILFILPYLHMGGAETQFRNLIIGLKKKYKITVYILSDYSLNDEFIVNNPEVKVKKIGVLFKENYKNKFLKLFSYIINYIYVSIKLIYRFFIYNEKYDYLVTYQEILSPLIPVCKIISNKIIFSIRSASKKILKRKYLKYLLNQCDVVVSNSYEAETYLKQIKVNNVKVILNGICKSKKYINTFRVPNIFKNIFIIARIHPTKNQLLVLKAFKEIDVNINFLGKVTDKNYKEKLIEFTKENDMQHRVKFYEYTKNMKNIWEESDLIILPSFEEGVANVILESYYNGKIILVSNINENKFLMKREKRLFDADNFKELREKYIFLLNEEKDILKNELDENFDYVENNFSLEVMIKNYENLLEGEQ